MRSCVFSTQTLYLKRPILLCMQQTHTNTLPQLPPYLLLDAWRGSAALWVVMVHSCLAYIANRDPEAIQNPLFSVSVWGQLGVVMFFVISGYCISGAAYSCISSGKSCGRYALDRIRRIYPPYLAACIVAIAVSILTSILQHWHLLSPSSSFQSLPFQDIHFWLTNLTLTHLPMGSSVLLAVSWSLCYEVAFYAIVGAFLLLSTALGTENPLYRSRFLVHACIITTIISLVWLSFSPQTCPFPLNLWYQFGFGALLFAIVSGGGWRLCHSLKMSATICIILGIYYACYGASSEGVIGHPSPRIQAFVCLLFFLTLLLLQPFNHKLSQWKLLAPLTWLGTFSYSIYLIHLIIIPFPDVGLRRMGFDGPLYILTYLAQVLVSISAGWLFFILVERRFISKRQEKRMGMIGSIR